MKIIKSIAWFLICAVGQLPVTTYAQNPLIIFVESQPNSTALHDEVANAVAAICPNLGGFGQAPGPQRDLFLRCNEMITTACDLNGLVDPATGMLLPCPGRTLEISDQELLAALQQVWGEELHSNSSLTTRVTSGQFSNIAGRMNALRLGGASGAVGGRGDLPGIGSIKSHRFADDQLSFYSG